MEYFKVLYVDDNPLCVVLFKVMLRNEFEVVSANSADEAIAILKNDATINIIVSDWKMPGMNGLDLIELIGKLFSDKTCFILSNYTDSNEIEPYIKAGILSNFFHKPLDKNIFLQEINKKYKFSTTDN